MVVTMDRRKRWVRRVAAGVALAGVVLALLPRPVASQSAHECPPPPSGVVALIPAPDHCHHAQPGPCEDMLGCLSAPPAMLTVPAGARLLDVHTAVRATPGPALHGRLALGPPTPPPNS
jgi:hypothetical protein